MEHERQEVQTEGGVVSRNHRVAGQVEMVGIVDLDTTQERSGIGRTSASHPERGGQRAHFR